MSIQSDDEDAKGSSDQQSTHGDTGSVGTGTMEEPAAGQAGQIQAGMEGIGERSGAEGGSQQSSQQGAMPPSQTDDDQYDQGTVQRVP